MAQRAVQPVTVGALLNLLCIGRTYRGHVMGITQPCLHGVGAAEIVHIFVRDRGRHAQPVSGFVQTGIALILNVVNGEHARQIGKLFGQMRRFFEHQRQVCGVPVIGVYHVGRKV